MRRSQLEFMRTCAGLAMLSACAANPLTGMDAPTSAIVWPPGEPNARIEVLFTYSGTDQSQSGRGFFARLGDFFAGSETFHFVSPYGIAGSLNERLFIADPGMAAVHVVDFERQTHSMLRGDEVNPMLTPVGVALAPDGRVYVTDTGAQCVHIFDDQGRLQKSFGGPSELGRPTGIAYDAAQERLLITDTTGGRVLWYDPDGGFVSAHGGRGDGAGQFNFPTNIAIAPDGAVVVVDTMNFRIQTLTPELEPRSTFGLAGDGPGSFARPKGVGLDSDGHIYVVDAMFDNVQIFDSTGALLLTFATSGNRFGKLFLPSGILIDDDDHVVIADAGNSRLQVFQYHSLQR